MFDVVLLCVKVWQEGDVSAGRTCDGCRHYQGEGPADRRRRALKRKYLLLIVMSRRVGQTVVNLLTMFAASTILFPCGAATSSNFATVEAQLAQCSGDSSSGPLVRNYQLLSAAALACELEGAAARSAAAWAPVDAAGAAVSEAVSRLMSDSSCFSTDITSMQNQVRLECPSSRKVRRHRRRYRPL